MISESSNAISSTIEFVDHAEPSEKQEKVAASAKFRIDVLGSEEDPNGIRIVFVQQQGMIYPSIFAKT